MLNLITLRERVDEIKNVYEACYRDNLHSIWANQELYRKWNSMVF